MANYQNFINNTLSITRFALNSTDEALQIIDNTPEENFSYSFNINNLQTATVKIIKNKSFQNLDLSSLNFDYAYLEACSFINCKMPSSKLTSYVNSYLENCDFSDSIQQDVVFGFPFHATLSQSLSSLQSRLYDNPNEIVQKRKILDQGSDFIRGNKNFPTIVSNCNFDNTQFTYNNARHYNDDPFTIWSKIYNAKFIGKKPIFLGNNLSLEGCNVEFLAGNKFLIENFISSEELVESYNPTVRSLLGNVILDPNHNQLKTITLSSDCSSNSRQELINNYGNNINPTSPSLQHIEAILQSIKPQINSLKNLQFTKTHNSSTDHTIEFCIGQGASFSFVEQIGLNNFGKTRSWVLASPDQISQSHKMTHEIFHILGLIHPGEGSTTLLSINSGVMPHYKYNVMAPLVPDQLYPATIDYSITPSKNEITALRVLYGYDSTQPISQHNNISFTGQSKVFPADDNQKNILYFNKNEVPLGHKIKILNPSYSFGQCLAGFPCNPQNLSTNFNNNSLALITHDKQGLVKNFFLLEGGEIEIKQCPDSFNNCQTLYQKPLELLAPTRDNNQQISTMNIALISAGTSIAVGAMILSCCFPQTTKQIVETGKKISANCWQRLSSNTTQQNNMTNHQDMTFSV